MDNKYQLFPDLTDDEYASLKADIADRGVQVAIEFDENGTVLDGYHRLRACQELGITDYPKVVRAGLSEDEKIEHALALNITRRNLSPERKIEVAKALKTQHPEWPVSKIAKMLHMREADLAGQLRSSPNLPTVEGEDGKQYPASEAEAERKREAIRDELENHPEKSDREIAKETGVSHHTVGAQRKKMVSVYNPSKRDAEALKDPDIVARMSDDNKLNVAGAIREQKRDQLVEHLESVEAKEVKAAAGVYDVVVVDPPWPMQKIERDERPNQSEFDYPTMSVDEIKAMKIPAADDCHVFLWTTQKFLMNGDALDILKAWGVKPVWCFVWVKDNGYKSFGLPMSNAEFVLYGHIGNPKFVDETDFWSTFNAPARGHSVKPEEFYGMVRHVTAGRRLDMFNRRPIEGFDTWGKEASDQ